MNKDELAKSLGMSKATLYKRIKELEIPKDSLDSLTDEQKNKLSSFKLNENKKKSNPTVSRPKDVNHYNNNLAELNKTLKEQLAIKDKQLEQAQKNIDNANKIATEAQKITDQAQQLQLDLQQKLHTSEAENLNLLETNKKLEDKVNILDSNSEKVKSLQEEVETQQRLNIELENKSKSEQKKQEERIIQINNDRANLTSENSILKERLEKQQDSTHTSFWQKLFGR